MKSIRTEDAVGHVLCHDITQIIKGVTKDAVFRKGHVVTKEDIPVLLSVGKENLYVWEADETMLHENDGAEVLRKICQGEGMHPTEVKEGKIELIADRDGLLKINREALVAVNGLGEMMIASRHGDFPVRAGDKIAGTRIIPLVIARDKMEAAQRVAGESPIFQVVPFEKKKVGVITTGSEVSKGRIEDSFTPVIVDKLLEYGLSMDEHVLSGDDPKTITEAIQGMLKRGCEMIICTGGMSVDPDDRTPLAIKNTGADIITYGAPVLPGAMFMLAYTKAGVPIMGLPGCVMYARRTIFDLVLPRILADDVLAAEDFIRLGEGGLCLLCDVCTFPNCGFGH
ncbi:MAG: molybdopterin-binding protein [Eubacterium aggregans]|uniref:Molybdopterin molybdenumtransferase n=1 Tax=Eubacterium aggregans TaxID=81409 RepID=A0A1H4BG00_9FIRM|nr:molybdopterin-binding protein [Eubacterium aggregans]MEA5073039.1 molybdopterin-binding protein [Eubacterium aggregans]SEA47027.1 molybdenum cofactor synthesis domain-containing protein [Eubacterium aggregans]